MARFKARYIAFSLIFGGKYEGDEDIALVCEGIDTDIAAIKDELPYIRAAAGNAYANQEEIDSLIDAHLTNRKINRIPPVTLAILRLAVSEILYLDDIPASVSINEAVELTKKYGDEKAYKFVNGVLGAIVRDMASDE